jgi:rare lipoprotein A
MIAAAVAMCLAACSASRLHPSDEAGKLSPRVIRAGDPVPKGGGVRKLGDPYLANGKWYTPVHDEAYDKVGQASWYGDLFHGRKTANGEVYDMNALTAAHPTFAMPTYAKVTNLANNRSIVVRVNDRGPYASDRIIDLSRRAAELLGFYNHGKATVRVQYYGPAPLNGDDSLERTVLARQPWAARVQTSQATRRQPTASDLLAAASDRPTPSSGWTTRTETQAVTQTADIGPRRRDPQPVVFGFASN